MSIKIKVDDGKIVIDINNFYQFYAVDPRNLVSRLLYQTR
jgi:hypothetical protein